MYKRQRDDGRTARDEFRTMVQRLHAAGIEVLLDVVYNHTGYTSSYTARKTAAGEGWIRVGEGNCEVNAVTCAVGGLPDLRTEIPEVRDHVLAANLGLARRTGVDGFRLDTYKHLAGDFWAEHRKRTRAELGQDFFLLAEYWGGTAESLDGFFERDEVDAGFDFSFKGSCEGWVTGRGRSVAYGAYLRSRHAARPGHVLAHYLSSHDEPMALGNLGDAGVILAVVIVNALIGSHQEGRAERSMAALRQLSALQVRVWVASDQETTVPLGASGEAPLSAVRGFAMSLATVALYALLR